MKKDKTTVTKRVESGSAAEYGFSMACVITALAVDVLGVMLVVCAIFSVSLGDYIKGLIAATIAMAAIYVIICAVLATIKILSRRNSDNDGEQ